MKIKIKSNNIAALQAALEKANGNAIAHTYRHASQILEVAVGAESQLAALQLNKRESAGAVACACSGSRLPSAYKYARNVTRVTLVRGSSDWFLTDIKSFSTFSRSEGETRVTLTAAQGAKAILKFGAQFSVNSAA
jgi:hypothetical protein